MPWCQRPSHQPVRAAIAFLIAAVVGGPVAPGAASAEDLVAFVVDGQSVPKPLTGTPGDPVAGAKASVNRGGGNCLACHVLPIANQPFQGDVGPDLRGVGARLNEGELRLRVINAKLVNPESVMPAFYKADGFLMPRKDLAGKPILTAQEVEDVVAYLASLKE
ncbi:MAG: sulfur oxidation c-type cytochrome SoxX [Azospirillum sp.]|nr:sulfur oxidation c-type cytochrome SoxX [Azospirillum sp.]